MTVFQLLMLAASAFFAYKIYEHIQTLQDPYEADGEHTPDDSIDEKSAKAFSPFDAATLVEKADGAFEEGDFQKALALLMEANEKQSGNSDVLFKIGYILQKQNDDEEALKYYKEALELDKDNEFIHNSMASIYRNNGEFTSARMHLQASLECDDENKFTYYNFGNLMVDIGNKEEALNMYEKAIEIDPDFTEAKEEIEKLQKAGAEL